MMQRRVVISLAVGLFAIAGTGFCEVELRKFPYKSQVLETIERKKSNGPRTPGRAESSFHEKLFLKDLLEAKFVPGDQALFWENSIQLISRFDAYRRTMQATRKGMDIVMVPELKHEAVIIINRAKTVAGKKVVILSYWHDRGYGLMYSVTLEEGSKTAVVHDAHGLFNEAELRGFLLELLSSFPPDIKA